MDTATVSELELGYRALLDHTSGFAMLLLAHDGRVIDRNRGACEMLGASAVYGGAPAGEIEQELAAAREHGSHAWERWQRGAGGRRFWAAVTITAVRDSAGEIALYLAIIRDLSAVMSAFHHDLVFTPPQGSGLAALGAQPDHRETESALRASREQLRRLTAEMNHLQENERRRIARELHDEMGQRLTALRLDLGLLRGELRQQRVPEAEQRVATMFAVIDETIATVRRLATELRPAILDDFGFRAAIEQELAAFSKRTGIGTTVSFDPPELTVDHDRATALYRIIQEALTNVARHSGASRVECTVELRERCIHAIVQDNGRGITEEEALTRLGLVGMRERALTLGGVAVIENIAGGGTRVAVAIPDEDPDRG